MSPLALEARGLVKTLGGRRVLDGAGLELRPGEIVGLSGANGAGKTTLLRILAGSLAAEAGEVLLREDGVRIPVSREPLHERARRGLGYLPQEPSAFLGLSASENLAAVLELRGRPRRAARLEAERALAEHGLGALASQRVATLSGGERRRLELARLLVTAPALLLLDEPFRGLDREAAAALAGRLRALAGEGRTTFFSEHAHGGRALELCDRTLELSDGRLVEIGGARMAAPSVERAEASLRAEGSALGAPRARAEASLI